MTKEVFYEVAAWALVASIAAAIALSFFGMG